ncbi:hypothetical protein [Pseudanabaena sp. ABRG5-3]|uniref:hypothetical protein n=1 Tax=Pseudanabaena sp. ABRG5-3 TaxID=685565 RepID=UPI000DC6FAAC|nr:hypothetical protein [Pseudanabaena sp. ABRG5-3]BBC24775.1 hypothetical protein ABRG53_2518 [Pseudanabaena sp. ABRG5-3]
MTAFNSSMLPTGTRQITTFEELNAWSAIVLGVANTKDRFIRKVGDASEQSCSFGDFPDSEGIQRQQSVAIVKIDPTKIGLSLPTWKTLQEVSSTAAPSYLLG